MAQTIRERVTEQLRDARGKARALAALQKHLESSPEGQQILDCDLTVSIYAWSREGKHKHVIELGIYLPDAKPGQTPQTLANGGAGRIHAQLMALTKTDEANKMFHKSTGGGGTQYVYFEEAPITRNVQFKAKTTRTLPPKTGCATYIVTRTVSETLSVCSDDDLQAVLKNQKGVTKVQKVSQVTEQTNVVP